MKIKEELKTLKNFEEDGLINIEDPLEKCGYMECLEDLKQEAIKWYKEIQNNPNFKLNIKQDDTHLTDAGQVIARLGALYVIKEFFNLSENEKEFQMKTKTKEPNIVSTKDIKTASQFNIATENNKKLANELYQINAWISLHWIGLKEKPTEKYIETLNIRLGEIIKELRGD